MLLISTNDAVVLFVGVVIGTSSQLPSFANLGDTCVRVCSLVVANAPSVPVRQGM